MREEKTRQGQEPSGTRNSMSKGPEAKHKLKRGSKWHTEEKRERVLAEPGKAGIMLSIWDICPKAIGGQ